MNFPIEWHVYIIPGFVFCCSIYFAFDQEKREKIVNFIEGKQIVSLIIITFISYLLGLIANIIISEWIRPLIVKLNVGYINSSLIYTIKDEVTVTQFSNENLYYNLRYGHDTLIIFRSLSFAFLILTSTIIIKEFISILKKIVIFLPYIVTIILIFEFFDNFNFSLPFLSSLILCLINLIFIFKSEVKNNKIFKVLVFLFLVTSLFLEFYYFKFNLKHKEFIKTSYELILNK